MSLRAIIFVLTASICLSPRGSLVAEIYFPPENVRDPANPKKPREVDATLPFIYLEPHEVCFDSSKPLEVTLYAVNRSGEGMKIDWPTIMAALSLEAIGPGEAMPRRAAKSAKDVEKTSKGFESRTIDLNDYFAIQGASVYRLSYARPLTDGRVHFSSPVTFVIEDFSALEKLAAQFNADLAGNVIAGMLKYNNVFVNGIQPKTYGNDFWWDEPEMNRICCATSSTEADKRWSEGIELLAQKNPPPNHIAALEALVDRLMWLSGNFRCPPKSRWFPWNGYIEDNLPIEARERINLKLVRSRDPRVVSHGMSWLSNVDIYRRYEQVMRPETLAALQVFFEIADGADKQLAHEAISSLSNYRSNQMISQFLRRKMTDSDPNVALHAAIVSCYSGDDSGFPVILRCTQSTDAELRLKAIAQLGGSQFRAHSAKILPLLLNELKNPLSHIHLERAIESLGSYQGQEVKDALSPFLNHDNEQVRRRANLSLERLQRNK